jgi:copper resistance protein C
VGSAPLTAVRRLAVVLLIVVASALALAAPASAHARLLASEPADAARVAPSPSQVVLLFNEELLPGAAVAVVDPAGRHWETAPARVDGGSVTVALAALPAGRTVSVTWTVISTDGDPVSGQLSFSTGAAAPATAPAPAPASASASASASAPPITSAPVAPAPVPSGPAALPPASGGAPGWLWAGLGVLAVAVIAAVALRRQRG